MAYYREHAHEGRDPDSLADLRERCAALISDELGTPISAQELVDSVRFSPTPTPSRPCMRCAPGS